MKMNTKSISAHLSSEQMNDTYNTKQTDVYGYCVSRAEHIKQQEQLPPPAPTLEDPTTEVLLVFSDGCTTPEQS